MRLDLLSARQAQADVTCHGTFRGDVLHAHRAEQLDLVAPCLRDEALGKIRTADTVWEARIVVDALGDPSLAAETAALDHDSVDALARRVDRRREAGGAAADDRRGRSTPAWRRG